MTGACTDDHLHVTWDPVSANCGEVLLATQTLADVSVDIAQLGVVNALLGAADALGWTRPGYLPPTVVWEGTPSPRHGLAMLRPWWLGVFDDAAQFLVWSELLNTQTPRHGCDWLIGARTHKALLKRLAQDTTPPSGDQLVLVHSDTDTFLLLE